MSEKENTVFNLYKASIAYIDGDSIYLVLEVKLSAITMVPFSSIVLFNVSRVDYH